MSPKAYRDSGSYYRPLLAEAEAKLKQAEATIARVEALAERWQHTQDRKRAANELRAALDQPDDQPKEPT